MLLPVCVSLILLPVLDADEDIEAYECTFLSVLAMTIQKQTNKTTRVVPCDSTSSKIAAKMRQVSSTFGTLAISRRQIATKIALKSQLVYTRDLEGATSARQNLH